MSVSAEKLEEYFHRYCDPEASCPSQDSCCCLEEPGVRGSRPRLWKTRSGFWICSHCKLPRYDDEAKSF